MIATSEPYVERYDHQVKKLGFQVGISEPFTEWSPATLPIRKCEAIWDTGTSTTVVRPSVAAALSLKQVRTSPFAGMHGTNSEVPTYIVDIHLPNGRTLNGITVVGAEIPNPQIEVLIGMDVLHHGDFAVSHFHGATTVTFRTPSCAEIDFMKEKERANEA